MKNLTDKIVVLTGAGSGIGRALAIQFAREGAQLILNDYDEKMLDETLSLIENKADKYVFDVSNLAAWQSMRDAVLEKYGHVDILINNAGVALGELSVAAVEIEQMKWLMDINYWGVVYGTKTFLESLMQRPTASIVNISSVFGLAGIATQSTYCSSKFAVRGFTESLRMESIGSNLCVSTVHPGGIDTNIVQHSKGIEEGERSDAVRRFKRIAKTSADEAAAVIIKGIRARKERILIGQDARALDRLVRFLPTKYSRILFKQLQKNRR